VVSLLICPLPLTLAFACKRSPEYIRMLERGKSSPTLRTLFALARALDLKLSEIVGKVEAVQG
jgi:transcriptional regulator with XRE-family HTH domain